ncbi:MAG: MxaK protein [Methylomicrobium sp.]|nr:MxaK protein [Methylomicrobium sp.]
MPSLNPQKKLTQYTSFHPFIAWLVFLILAGFALNELNQIRMIWRLNDLIENPEKISASDTDLPPEVLFAKARYLNDQGDYQEALRLYLQIEHQGNDHFRLKVQYNMGVIYLQQASKLWKSKGVWEYSQINTLLDLTEQYLRQVLSKQPDHWQARFNLEYALRIRPPAKEEEKSDWQGHKSSVHAIMPGIPEGGP